MIKQMILLV